MEITLAGKAAILGNIAAYVSKSPFFILMVVWTQRDAPYKIFADAMQKLTYQDASEFICTRRSNMGTWMKHILYTFTFLVHPAT